MPARYPNNDGVNIGEMVGRNDDGAGRWHFGFVVKAELHHHRNDRQQERPKKPKQARFTAFTHLELLTLKHKISAELAKFGDEITIPTADNSHIAYARLPLCRERGNEVAKSTAKIWNFNISTMKLCRT